MPACTYIYMGAISGVNTLFLRDLERFGKYVYPLRIDYSERVKQACRGMFMPCVVIVLEREQQACMVGLLGCGWVCYEPLFWCIANLMPSICQVFVKLMHKKKGLPTPVVPSKCQAFAHSCQVNAQFVLNFISHNSFISNILRFYPMYISF